MITKHLCNLFDLNINSHADIEFIDIDISRDTPLFLDPCLIYTNESSLSQVARATLEDYMDQLYGFGRQIPHCANLDSLVSHLGERNEARLGYGNGLNGKGSTPEGMIQLLTPLPSLIQDGIPMNHPIDLPIFLPDFAEDRMTDMLVNILFMILSDFTQMQCQVYGIATHPISQRRYFWNTVTHSWEIYSGNCLEIEGHIILLIPKQWVRPRYYYRPEQYLQVYICGRLQEERAEYIDGKEILIPKKEIAHDEISITGSVINANRYYTAKYPELLNLYHKEMPNAYLSRGMSDADLDAIVYRNIDITA